MREVRFEVDGESLAGKLHEPAGTVAPRGQVVLVHGLMSQSAEFGEMPAKLAERGWRVLALDQRGFGASGGARGITTQERATSDIRAAVSWLRKERPNLPVALVGHSMGAVFALRALAEDPTIRTAVLACPMDTVAAELKGYELAGYRALHALTRTGLRIKIPYKYASDYRYLYHDPEAARRAKQEALLQRSVDVSNYPAFMAMSGAREAPRVRQPILTLLAEHDRAVRRSSSLRVHDALAGPKELATVKSGHSLWGDMSAAAAVDHVDRWLRANLK